MKAHSARSKRTDEHTRFILARTGRALLRMAKDEAAKKIAEQLARKPWTVGDITGWKEGAA